MATEKVPAVVSRPRRDAMQSMISAYESSTAEAFFASSCTTVERAEGGSRLARVRARVRLRVRVRVRVRDRSGLGLRLRPPASARAQGWVQVSGVWCQVSEVRFQHVTPCPKRVQRGADGRPRSAHPRARARRGSRPIGVRVGSGLGLGLGGLG